MPRSSSSDQADAGEPDRKKRRTPDLFVSCSHRTYKSKSHGRQVRTQRKNSRTERKEVGHAGEWLLSKQRCEARQSGTLGWVGLFTFTNALPCDLPWAPPWLPWPGTDRVGSPSTWLVKTAPSQRFSTRSERWKCAMRPPRPPRCTGATLRAFLWRTGLDLTSPAAHAINHRPNTLPQVLTLHHLLR